MVKYKGPRPITTQARALNEKSSKKIPPVTSQPSDWRVCLPAGEFAARQEALPPSSWSPGPKEEEANYASGGYRGGYRGNYYGQNSRNWRDRHENRNSNPGEENPQIPCLPEKKPDESKFKKTMREFVITQKKANDFVKNQFYNLKTKVKQGQKNHQAAIQDLEIKFGRISDHQSSRPTDTLPSNTQPNPKPSTSNKKPYRPPPA
ncbi:hypothetical protein Tco_0742046 [Tanacetum coccineum]